MTTPALCRLALVGLMALAGPLAAQQLVRVDDHQIHYSAVPTHFLPEAVTEAHGIPRSRGLGLVNVSVIEEREGGTTRHVPARIEGRVGGLDGGDVETLDFRRLRIGDAPSGVAVFRIRDNEPMRFELEVRHDRNAAPAEVRFIQRFHIER